MISTVLAQVNVFQPTPSARRVTFELLFDIFGGSISTHTLRKEGDWTLLSDVNGSIEFQPTPSARRVTTVISLIFEMAKISTHTLRKEGDCLI